MHNPAGAEDKRLFYSSMRTDGHFADVLFTMPLNGKNSWNDTDIWPCVKMHVFEAVKLSSWLCQHITTGSSQPAICHMLLCRHPHTGRREEKHTKPGRRADHALKPHRRAAAEICRRGRPQCHRSGTAACVRHRPGCALDMCLLQRLGGMPVSVCRSKH